MFHFSAIIWAERLAQPLTFVTVTDGSEYKYLVWDEAKMAAGNNPVDPPLLAALAKAREAGLTHVSCVRASGSGIACRTGATRGLRWRGTGGIGAAAAMY